jgi:cation:H+ antiporter
VIILNEILFLLFAFFTVFLSIKLSYYVDYLNRKSKINGAVLAGVFLASITSLPECVTCFSAIFVNNYSLAVGDILGSNIFNIFMICVFDLFYIKKAMFSNMKKSHFLVFILLFINYLVMYLFLGKVSFFSIPTFVIFITYAYYLYKVSSKKEEKAKINDYSFDNNIILKLIITAVLMMFSSIILTIIVNNLAKMHPYFASSFLGAIFLGITTSLPEVVTCYSLINMNSFDLALDDIIGSNFFNLLVLALGDLFIKDFSIFSAIDSGVVTLVVLGTIFTLLAFLNTKYKKYYGFLSFFIIIMYLGYWIINFLG